VLVGVDMCGLRLYSRQKYVPENDLTFTDLDSFLDFVEGFNNLEPWYGGCHTLSLRTHVFEFVPQYYFTNPIP